MPSAPRRRGHAAALIVLSIALLATTGSTGPTSAVGLPAAASTTGLRSGPAAAPTVSPGGPVLQFMGQRFAVCRGAPGFESVAFDPVHQQIASQAKIYDLCANFVSAGPDEYPGLAWDATSGYYWQITGDRVVRRWNGAALVDTVFTIPLRFDVPGSGPDTLESVRGIAVDTQFVYVVDAGPVPGALASNEWFKFTRTGVPVKSSKSTDLVAHLDADPDALVDDIVWVPPSAPFAQGLLLIALEHSGIQVVDSNGAFVDRFRWSTQGLPAGVKLAAFAGLSIDPATGNLYLMDNDKGVAQVWVRIPSQAATGYLVGTGSDQAYLQMPTPGCNLPLWKDLSPGTGTVPNGIFGIDYRTVDNRVYGYDFSVGTLWAFSPLLGEATLIDATGPVGIWGMAYDTDRDVLYGAEQVVNGARIHVIDPLTGNESMLPNQTSPLEDIAFDSVDHFIYGVVGGTELVRINRDTGQQTLLPPANLPHIRGLAFDPASGHLLGIANFPTTTLYSIDPATQVATPVAVLTNSIGWEGLALVSLPANATGVEPGALVLGPPGARTITAFPNPAAGPIRLEFSLPTAGEAWVTVFDLRGRLVRELRAGALGAGDHALLWDGSDAGGARVASGVYWVRVSSGDGSASASGRVVQVR
jgi:hypothetical protein